MRYLLSIVLFFLYQSNYAQHQEKVDFLRAEVLVHPMPGEKKIEGSVTYEFEVLSDVDSVFLDAKNMEFYRVQLNKKKARYAYNGKTISLYKKLKNDKADLPNT